MDNYEYRVTPDRSTLTAEESLEKTTTTQVVRAPPQSHRDNTFQGSRASVSNREDLVPALHAIFRDTRVARASHNIYAYRLEADTGLVEYYDDDGDNGAGRRLLDMLQRKNITNTLLCVSRWHGGTNLGPLRFSHINEAAECVLQM